MIEKNCPAGPRYIAVTHEHIDHFGGMGIYASRFPDAVVCGSSVLADVVAPRADRESRWRHSLQGLVDVGILSGSAERSVSESLGIIPPVARVLRDGDVIETDAGPVQVVETPGHSEGSISFFHVPTATLICGDAAGSPQPDGRTWPTAFYSLSRYSESIEKMLALNPAALCNGHNRPVTSERVARRILEKNIDAITTITGLIAQYWREYEDLDRAAAALDDHYRIDEKPQIAFIMKYGHRGMVASWLRENGAGNL